jgi:hypothetical protein
MDYPGVPSQHEFLERRSSPTDEFTTRAKRTGLATETLAGEY